MISVIMGVYNAEKTVERAIRSLFTYRGEMQVIAVDDGSADRTAEILSALAGEFPSLKILSNDSNRGLTYCLNRALKECNGEFIARLDADDINREGRFEKQLAFLTENPQYAFVGGNALLFDEEGAYARRRFPQEVALSQVIRENPFIHPTLMFRKSALDKVNGYRDIEKTVRCEDYDLVFRLYAAKLYGRNLNEDLISYYEPRKGGGKHTKRTRRNEFYVRRYGSRINRSLKGRLYAFKPLILSIIPAAIYRKFHKAKQEKI